jgi:hypothetical protein
MSFPAWGNAPGIRTSQTILALKARFRVSIPRVTLIEIDAVFAQQRAVFFLERAIAMMLSLPLDVFQHGIELTREIVARYACMRGRTSESSQGSRFLVLKTI